MRIKFPFTLWTKGNYTTVMKEEQKVERSPLFKTKKNYTRLINNSKAENL